MSDNVFLKKIGEFSVTVSPYVGTFTATNRSDISLNAKTLEKLEDKIKVHKREQRKFKPVYAIRVEHDDVGRITSRTAENNEVYFIVKNKVDGNKRYTEPIFPYSWHNDRAKFTFALETPENLLILEKIKILENQKDQLTKEQQNLRSSYSNMVTDEVIEKAASEK